MSVPISAMSTRAVVSLIEPSGVIITIGSTPERNARKSFRSAAATRPPKTD
jgi:hypothetical protein